MNQPLYVYVRVCMSICVYSRRGYESSFDVPFQ